jgi:hypothetical protein
VGTILTSQDKEMNMEPQESPVATLQHAYERVCLLEEMARKNLEERVSASKQEYEQTLKGLDTPQLVKVARMAGVLTEREACMVSRKDLTTKLSAQHIHVLRENNVLHHKELEALQVNKSRLEFIFYRVTELQNQINAFMQDTNTTVSRIDDLAALLEL